MVNDAGPQTPPKHPSENEAALVTADDGPWRTVGQYMHFAPDLVQKADAVRREIFGREEGEHVPPYIAVHIRHGACLFPAHPPSPLADGLMTSIWAL